MHVLLVIIGSDRHAVREALKQQVHIDQEISERVLVVSGDPAALKAAAALPGVVAEGALSSREVLDSLGLTDAERLGVAAWLERQANAERKVRRGEGLNWDTKGFEPP